MEQEKDLSTGTATDLAKKKATASKKSKALQEGPSLSSRRSARVAVRAITVVRQVQSMDMDQDGDDEEEEDETTFVAKRIVKKVRKGRMDNGH
jgi:hypothetical protein